MKNELETVRTGRPREDVPTSRELTEEQLKQASGGSGAAKPARPL